MFEVIKFGNICRLSKLPDGIIFEQEYRLYAANIFLGVGFFTPEDNHILLRPKRLISGLSTLQPWL